MQVFLHKTMIKMCFFTTFFTITNQYHCALVVLYADQMQFFNSVFSLTFKLLIYENFAHPNHISSLLLVKFAAENYLYRMKKNQVINEQI
jgi:hypothetical protein